MAVVDNLMQDVEPAPQVAGAGIVVDSLTFRYETGLTALDRLDLTIPWGASLGIVGPSGCGKTTLLHLLAGIRQPTAGEIRWPEIPRGVRQRTMVFQSDTLLPWLTVSRNIAFGFRLKGARRRSYAGRVRELLELVGLQDFADAYPYELSGGMRRRVAFLTAIAPRPSTLLLDEPFASLDEPTRVAIHGDVLRIMNESESTLVLITHDLAEAISLCDEVAMMSRRPGRIVSRHRVPFSRDRDVYQLRQTKEFLDLYATLWHQLSEQIHLPADTETT